MSRVRAGLTALVVLIAAVGVARADYVVESSPAEWIAHVAARHGGVLSNGPNCGVVSHGGDADRIFLGHFTGGNSPVAWQDVYACFAARVECNAWLRDMKWGNRRLDGYKSCEVIR